MDCQLTFIPSVWVLVWMFFLTIAETLARTSGTPTSTEKAATMVALNSTRDFRKAKSVQSWIQKSEEVMKQEIHVTDTLKRKSLDGLQQSGTTGADAHFDKFDRAARAEEKMYVLWMNNHLKESGKSISDLGPSLRNGVLVMQVLSKIALLPPLKYAKRTLVVQQELDNWHVIVRFMRKLGIQVDPLPQPGGEAAAINPIALHEGDRREMLKLFSKAPFPNSIAHALRSVQSEDAVRNASPVSNHSTICNPLKGMLVFAPDLLIGILLQDGRRVFTTTQLFMILNYTSSISIVFLNKIAYRDGFPSITLTMLHFILTYVGLKYSFAFVPLKICAAFGIFQVKRINVMEVLPLCLAFCGFVVFTNLSLLYNTVGFYQLAKVMTTPAIVFIHRMFYQQTYSWQILFSLADVSVNLLGLIFATCGIVVTAIYQIWVKTKQQDLEVSAFQLLYYQ
eukprot:gene4515-8556_t